MSVPQPAHEQARTVERPPTSVTNTALLQRKCACGGTPGPNGECATCKAKRLGLQRKAITPTGSSLASPIANQPIHSTGQSPDGAAPATLARGSGHDIGHSPIRTRSAGALQTKLAINEPGDRYEQEADRIADQVLAAPVHAEISSAPPRIQRFTGQPSGQAATAPASVDHVLASPGRPLEPALRQDMEQRFGHDFSGVRVHSGSAAEQSAQDVNAHAYTVGNNMVFGVGQLAPGTHDGRRLIAHELTHVLQQSGEGVSQVQRQSRSHLRDRCGSEGDPVPCVDWSSVPHRARLSNYLAKAADDSFGRSVNTVVEVLKASVAPSERVQLLRIACCQLEPKDAEFLQDVFAFRRGTAGKAFGDLSTSTRCSLLSILQNRAAVAHQSLSPDDNLITTIRVAIGSDAGIVDDRILGKRAFQASSGLNLGNPAILISASEAVRKIAGLGAMVEYLALVEQALPHRKLERRAEQFPGIVQPRGVYKTYGGVIAPAMLRVVATPFAWLVNFAQNFQAFLRGLHRGISESVTVEAAEEFGIRLAGSVVLSFLFPPPFLAGTLAGFWMMAKGFVETIINIKEVVTMTLELISTMFTADGYDFAKAMGEGMGVEFGQTIVQMSQKNLVIFVYELGKLVGPAILLAVLSLLGLPEAAGAAVSARITEILSPFVKRFPRLVRREGKVIKKLTKVETELKTISEAERHIGQLAKSAKKVEVGAKEMATLEHTSAKTRLKPNEALDELEIAKGAGARPNQPVELPTHHTIEPHLDGSFCRTTVRICYDKNGNILPEESAAARPRNPDTEFDEFSQMLTGSTTRPVPKGEEVWEELAAAAVAQQQDILKIFSERNRSRKGGRSEEFERRRGTTTRTKASEKARHKDPLVGTAGHHGFPQYFGGRYEQVLVDLPNDLHYLYHEEVDKILQLPRKYGSAYYRSLSKVEMSNLLDKLLIHAKEFDQRYRTKIEAALRQGIKEANPMAGRK